MSTIGASLGQSWCWRNTLWLLILFLLHFAWSTHSSPYYLDNGVGKTPAMGFNTWNTFGPFIDENLILQTIEAWKKYKLDEYGYNYLIIDDGWSSYRSPETHRIMPNATRFPRGMKFIADKIHENGLKFGMYGDVGLKTCEGLPGSFGYYNIDAEMFAEYEIDYLKFDYCFLAPEQSNYTIRNDYKKMSNALLQTKRPIYFSICTWGEGGVEEWGSETGNSWRTTIDIKTYWSRVMYILDLNEPLHKYAHAGAFNDPDMLVVGVHDAHMHDSPGNLTKIESKAHFSLWAMMSAPLLLGNDIRNIPDWVLDIITNEYIIRIDQDPLAKQGYRIFSQISKNVHTEIWKKPLSKSKLAVLFFNRANDEKTYDSNYKETETLKLTKKMLDIPYKRLRVFDCWKKRDLGEFEREFTSEPLRQHDVQVLILTPVDLKIISSQIIVVLAIIAVLVLLFSIGLTLLVVGSIQAYVVRKKHSKDGYSVQQEDPNAYDNVDD